MVSIQYEKSQIKLLKLSHDLRNNVTSWSLSSAQLIGQFLVLDRFRLLTLLLTIVDVRNSIFIMYWDPITLLFTTFIIRTPRLPSSVKAIIKVLHSPLAGLADKTILFNKWLKTINTISLSLEVCD